MVRAQENIVVKPKLVSLIAGIVDGAYPTTHGRDMDGGYKKTELIGDAKSDALASQITKSLSKNWDLDISFEWRGGKLSLSSKDRTVLSLPYIKLSTSVLLSTDQIQSDTFVLTNFDRISTDPAHALRALCWQHQ